MVDEEERDPYQVVERIRTHKFLLDIESESESVREGARNLQTQLNNALRLLSEDLYSKKSHFVLEIVQNADDNAYRADSIPELVFEVSPSRLVVVNNEVGFSEENVAAICSVGASSKSKDKTGYIGEKGIGFKSVFTVSNAPEIHSNGFHFKFDRTDEANLLGYVVPHWCPPPEGLRADCTTIILPAAAGYAFDDSTLAELDARLLLFLNKLSQLTLVQGDKRSVYKRTELNGASYLTSATVVATGQPTLEEHRYVRVSRTFDIENKFADEKRKGIHHSTVVLAFPVDDGGAAKPEPNSNVFAFLPIRQMGFRFPIQADFILSSSREEVLTDRPWNKFLCGCIADTFAASVEKFKTSDVLAFTYLRYVPAEGEVADSFFQSVRTSIIKRLAATACLPSDSGTWKNPADLRMADKAFRALFPSKVALELFGFDYVDLRVQGGVPLLRTLGVKDVGAGEVLDFFRTQGKWLCAQALDWRAKFYGYIAEQQETLIKAGLLKVPSLPISDGSLVIPSTAHVFFPLGRGRKYGFEHELALVDNALYEAAKGHSERVAALFAEMQVRSDRPYELVRSHILPKHKGGGWKSSKFDALVGHLRYVKDKLPDYLAAALVDGKSKAQAFQELREGMWIGTKKVENGSWSFNRIGELYLGKEYKSFFCVETLLPDSLGIQNYVSADYLYLKSKEPEKEAESWREFFAELGVRTSPALQRIGADWHCSQELQLLLESQHTSVRRAVLECLSLNWRSYAERMTYTASIGRNRFVSYDTQFAQTLWSMPAPLKKKATVPLSETYYSSSELKSLLGDGLPYIDAILSEAMLDACRITHKLNADALVKRLKQLKEGDGATLKQIQGIYRWLDERLWESEGRLINETFESEALVLVRGAHKGWFSPSELSWRSNGRFLDSLYPPIQSHYRDFSRFFQDRLGIPRELPTSKWVEALEKLSQIEDVSVREAEAMAIYRRANRDLQPRFGREVEIPDWVETFRTCEVFLNQRGALVANDEYLLVNDAPEFAQLFFDEEDLSFVAVPPSEVPRLSRLLDAADVARLSNSLVVEVVDGSEGVINTDLTMRLRRSYGFLARILYAKHPDAFARSLEDNTLIALRTLTINEVAAVSLRVSIGEYRRETATEAAIAGCRFLYRSGARSIKDRLAVELSKVLGASQDLADAFARVLLEDDPESIEAFLAVRGIGDLPSDLLAAVEGQGRLLDAPEDQAHEEANEAGAGAQPGATDLDGESSSEVGEATDDSGVPVIENDNAIQLPVSAAEHRQVTASEESSTRDFRVAPTAVTGRLDEDAALQSPVAPALEISPLNDGSADQSSSKKPLGSFLAKPSPVPAGTRPIREAGRNPSGGSSEEGSTPAGHPSSHMNGDAKTRWRPLTQVRSSRPNLREPGLASAAPRTKGGRLLSYVEGPGASSGTDRQEDMAKAAARDATGRAAVDYFLRTQSSRWRSLTEMPHHNPGFDILAVGSDGEEEYIEVKGQSGAWTQEGVALTPRELLTAHEKGHRYWLCIVEFAQDDRRRQLHLLQNPFGLTQQFRFDVGWKAAAESVVLAPMRPEKDLYIDMPGVGLGRILSVRGKGKFYNLHVIFHDGRQVNSPFNPAKMTLSKESLWQG